MYYIAMPYTLDMETNYKRALKLTATALALEICVFSPVVHSHNLAENPILADKPHEFWMRHCINWLSHCDGAIFVKLDGWEKSEGYAQELAWCKENDKPFIECDAEHFVRHLVELAVQVSGVS